MARSRRKNGGPTRGRFKPKKMGKGFSTSRSQPSGNRPVLRITETEGAGTEGDGTHGDDGGKAGGGKD